MHPSAGGPRATALVLGPAGRLIEAAVLLESSADNKNLGPTTRDLGFVELRSVAELRLGEQSVEAVEERLRRIGLEQDVASSWSQSARIVGRQIRPTLSRAFLGRVDPKQSNRVSRPPSLFERSHHDGVAVDHANDHRADRLRPPGLPRLATAPSSATAAGATARTGVGVTSLAVAIRIEAVRVARASVLLEVLGLSLAVKV
jgi:hypothetical protein